jgi:hypothetical protein
MLRSLLILVNRFGVSLDLGPRPASASSSQEFRMSCDRSSEGNFLLFSPTKLVWHPTGEMTELHLLNDAIDQHSDLLLYGPLERRVQV